MKQDPILKENVLLRDSGASQPWIKAGFRVGDKGTHTSRTLLFKELELLFEDQKQGAPREGYVSAIIDQNCLEKKTVSTRKLTCQRLSELYGLDPSIPLFRFLRHLWQFDETGRPLLALLTALARDPLLRVTSTPIFKVNTGEELMRQKMKEALRQSGACQAPCPRRSSVYGFRKTIYMKRSNPQQNPPEKTFKANCTTSMSARFWPRHYWRLIRHLPRI